jgi:hypothetical protein
MTNRIQLMLIATWCKHHGKALEAGAIEWIALYASVFRSITAKG